MDMTETNMMQMFGLTPNQLNILFSVERQLVLKDYQGNAADIDKEHWLTRWSELLSSQSENKITFISDYSDLMCAISAESQMSYNKTWLYLMLMEATLFQPYTPLGEKADVDKRYKKLRYKPQTETLKFIARQNGIKEECIDRFRKTYQKACDTLTGKVQKIALGAVSVVAVSAIVAATAGAMAGPIAVALVGSNFAYGGAALTSASLAFLGGGAVAAGGAGMAGGVAAIVGGGALLGAAGGGAVVSTVGLLAKTSPAVTITQAAKLEVVLKEILLNAQQDTQNAQMVMENFRQQINELQKVIEQYKAESREDKKVLSQMKTSLEYLRKAYRDMAKFKSSYEIGMNAS